MNKRFSSDKGITLVALVVTIIVLLILAGVTVAMVLGSTGILGRAGQGREAQERAAIEEQIELGKTDAYMGEREGQEYFTTLRGYLTDNEVITSIAKPVTAEQKGSSLILTVGEKYVYQITREETTLLGDVASAYVPDVDLKEGIIQFTTTGYNYNNNTYARDSVGVSIAIGDSAYSSYSIEYKVGSAGTWTTYSAPFNVTEETTVYARLANTISNTQTEEYYATEDITNIDKQAPSNVTFTIDAESVTDSEVKVTASATDDKGIAGYKFSATKDGTESWTTQQTSTSYTFTGLDGDTEYTIKVQAIDVAERTTTSDSQTQNTVSREKTVSNSKRTSSTDTTVLSTTETTTVKDNKNNEFKVPANFGIAYDSADNVADGIVIEDSEHNQYVWIPVGTAITRANGTTMEAVTLGRYNFDARWNSSSSSVIGTGTASLVQNATAWATPTKLTPTGQSWDTYEYSATDSAGSSYGNTKANNLKNFVEHTNNNKGYYIARYEAGYTETKPTTSNGIKPKSQSGQTVMDYITQADSATLCQNLYTSCTSDLMNSYAWDTAIVFIQKSSGSNDYARRNEGTLYELKETGTSGDVQCNINDLAKNAMEWTTESSSYTARGFNYSCVFRAGPTGSGGYFVAYRGVASKSESTNGLGFRPILYLQS